MSTPNFEPPKIYQCQGIGKGAKCGRPAPVELRSNKWNVETNELDEISVYVCQAHADELRAAMNRGRNLITPDHVVKPGETVAKLPEGVTVHRAETRTAIPNETLD